MQAVTVSQINRYVKEMLSLDPNLHGVTVKGEISNFTNHQRTGHFYFTLKDESASIRAVMFRGNASKVKFRVENGMNVIITGSVQVFERDGIYQLYCDTMEPDGIGALYLAFEQLKEKLAGLGLFDPEHKKPIPKLPRRIGVVTSKTGAALQDILNILSRRYPLATVILIPALVQGENCPASVVEGIRLAQERGDIDVLIVGRGGGSIEDLWGFNDERVAYAIYNCTIPVISAVGHEIDFTISDFVADLRAPTPSAAAELCAPDISTIYDRLANQYTLLRGYTASRLQQSYERLKTGYARLTALSPITKVKHSEQELASKSVRLNLSAVRLLETKTDHFLKTAATLEAMSPLKVLTRGYSITYSGENILTSAGQIKPGDPLKTVLSDGFILSEAIEIQEGQSK